MFWELRDLMPSVEYTLFCRLFGGFHFQDTDGKLCLNIPIKGAYPAAKDYGKLEEDYGLH